MKALLLCAGLGSRFHPQTLKCPKPALPFLNVPIVGWPLKVLEDAGVADVVINTHHKPSQVEKTVQSLSPRIKNIKFSYEPRLLGGAGALKKNEALLKDENIIYLNGDSIFLCRDFFLDLKRRHQNNKSLITFLVRPAFSEQESQLWADCRGRVLSVFKKPSSAGKGYFFSGMALVHQECFSILKSTDFNIFLDLAVKFPKRCFVFEVRDLTFFEAGRLSSYLNSTRQCLEYLLLSSNSMQACKIKQTLNRFLGDFKFEKNLLYASQTALPQDPGGLLLCGEQVHGVKNAAVKGFAVIGSHCHIKKPLCIHNGVLAGGVQIDQDQLSQMLVV